jgi:hypothetical protein
MFTWLPTDALTVWLGQYAWLVLLVAIVVPACIVKALRHGINSDGWPDLGPSDHSNSCGGD